MGANTTRQKPFPYYKRVVLREEGQDEQQRVTFGKQWVVYETSFLQLLVPSMKVWNKRTDLR